MIYQLQEEIKHFKKETYFEGEGLITTNKGQFSGKIVPKKAFKTQEELTKEIEKLGAHLGKQNGRILEVTKKEKRLHSPRLFSLSSLQTKMNQLMKASAKATLDAAQGLYERILEVTKKEKRLHSPRLFSLSSLQTKMNQLMKASAKATLDAAQGLYESKFLSYPRTDSFYITENEHQYLVKHLQNYKKFLGIEEVQTTEIKAKKRYVDAKKVQEHHAITENEHQYLVKHLQNYKKFLGIEEVQTTEIKAKKRYVDAKKVQEHHAIIPTKTIPTPARFAKLSKLQQAIYLQVLRTTVAMFAADYIYEETTVMTGVQQLKLKSIGKIPLQQGWQEILRIKSKKKEAQTLPPIVENEEAEVELKSMEKETQPPKPYTEGTLITAMKTAGKTLDNDEAQEILKEVEGIGTEATRANIIENLKQKHYIEVNKNEITVTPKGITLCKAVANEPLLTSAEMTARWEGYLRKIGKQEGTPSVFLENIKKFILHLLAEVPNQIDKVDFSDEISGTRQIKAMEKKNDQLGRCPKCKKGIVMLYPKIATCLNPECDFKLWPTVAKKKLTKTNLRDLLSKGKTSKVVKGFTGKKGKFDAVLVLKEDMTIGFSFPWIENSGTKAVDGNKETSRKNNENEVE